MSRSRSRIRSQFCIKASSPLARRTTCAAMMKSAAFTSRGNAVSRLLEAENPNTFYGSSRVLFGISLDIKLGERRPPRAQQHGQDDRGMLRKTSAFLSSSPVLAEPPNGWAASSRAGEQQMLTIARTLMRNPELLCSTSHPRDWPCSSGSNASNASVSPFCSPGRARVLAGARRPGLCP